MSPFLWQSPYQMGARSRQWLKVRARLTQDTVIAGFTEPKGRRPHFGALVLGVYDSGKLVYIGHTGGGFSVKALAEMRDKMDPFIRKTCPFKTAPKTNAPVTWLKPQLVCEVAFHGWTDDNLLRQPVFLRLRDDKPAREVIRETGGST
jgi:bifunctional non-homologous end joining protein LigD